MGDERLLAGDVDMDKLVVGDCINATTGFVELGSLKNIPSKSLMRMFEPSCIPTSETCSES